MVTFTGNSVGDTATYTCDPGFELIGTATTTCIQVDVNTVEFSPDPPACMREYYYYYKPLLTVSMSIVEQPLIAYIHSSSMVVWNHLLFTVYELLHTLFALILFCSTVS